MSVCGIGNGDGKLLSFEEEQEVIIGYVHEQSTSNFLNFLLNVVHVKRNGAFEKSDDISLQMELLCYIYLRFCLHLSGEPAKYDPSFNGPLKNR